MAHLAIVHPFIRVSVGVWEGYTEQDYNGVTFVSGDPNYFGSYLFGVGVAFTVFPLISIYGEYLYNTADVDGDELKSNSFHIGLRLSI